MNKDIGEVLYEHDIKINEKLTKDVKLFGTEYYSAALEIIRSKHNCADLRRYVVAFLQLLVGAYGQDFVQNLNEELFESAPDDYQSLMIFLVCFVWSLIELAQLPWIYC